MMGTTIVIETMSGTTCRRKRLLYCSHILFRSRNEWKRTISSVDASEDEIKIKASMNFDQSSSPWYGI